MAPIRLLLLPFALGLAIGTARAQNTEIWRCVDMHGNILFTNERSDTSGKQCTLMSREHINILPQVLPALAPSQVSAGRKPLQANSPRETGQTSTYAQPVPPAQADTPPLYDYVPSYGYTYSEQPSFFFARHRGHLEYEGREREEHESSHELRRETPNYESREQQEERAHRR